MLITAAQTNKETREETRNHHHPSNPAREKDVATMGVNFEVDRHQSQLVPVAFSTRILRRLLLQLDLPESGHAACFDSAKSDAVIAP